MAITLRGIGILMLMLLLQSLLAGCDDDCEATDPDPSCVCIALYDPVCGCDGVTYGNSCEAECHNITDYTPGECP